jgi:hypothetical protein
VVLMVNSQDSARRMSRLRTDAREILAHAANARATACRGCGAGVAQLAGDIARLLAAITWLDQSLIIARLRAANLEAAIRAALGAQEDGDHDPIGYLRDEITPDTGAAYGA